MEIRYRQLAVTVGLLSRMANGFLLTHRQQHSPTVKEIEMRRFSIALYAVGLLVVLIQKDNPLVGHGLANAPLHSGRETGASESCPRGQSWDSAGLFFRRMEITSIEHSPGGPKDTPPRRNGRIPITRNALAESVDNSELTRFGDKVTFRIISAMAPSNEGREAVCILTNQGDDMVLTNRASDGSKSELRLRRAKVGRRSHKREFVRMTMSSTAAKLFVVLAITQPRALGATIRSGHGS